MKNQLSNIALEGTCSGNVAGGLLLWTGEAFRRFCFERGKPANNLRITADPHQGAGPGDVNGNTPQALTTTLNL